jgi:hypothetical protein
MLQRFGERRVRPFCHPSPADLAEIINSLVAAGLWMWES